MAFTFPVPLAPSNLARPPILWSAAEVKAWVEFCVQEFSLSPIAFDRFDMNGKALMLLNRSDFMERAPRAGDVLFNALTRLSSNSKCNASVKTPVFLSTCRDFGSQRDYITSRTKTKVPTTPNPTSSPFIPIRPHPTIPLISQSQQKGIGSGEREGEESLRSEMTVLDTVPASVLSPAATDKSSSDTESGHNDVGSPTKLGYSPPAGKDHKAIHFSSTSDHSHDEDEVDMEVTSGTSEHKEDGRLLWEFIYQLLKQEDKGDIVSWENADDLVFRINDPTGLADMWGSRKNRSNMTYEKLSRALRYYYKVNIIKKVHGKKLTYRFLKSPEKIRKGQRGARPRDFMSRKAGIFNKSIELPKKEESFTSSDSLTNDGGEASPESSFTSMTNSSFPEMAKIRKDKEKDEEDIPCTENATEETKTDCSIRPRTTDSLINLKSLPLNFRYLQAMKCDDSNQHIDGDDATGWDYTFGSERHGRKSISSSISKNFLLDQTQSKSTSQSEIKEGENCPELDINIDKCDPSEKSIVSKLNNECGNTKPGTNCFEQDSFFKKCGVFGDVETASISSAIIHDFCNDRTGHKNGTTSSTVSPDYMKTEFVFPFIGDGSLSLSPKYVSIPDFDSRQSQGRLNIQLYNEPTKTTSPIALVNSVPTSELELETTTGFNKRHTPLSSHSCPPSGTINNSNEIKTTASIVSRAYMSLNRNPSSPLPLLHHSHDHNHNQSNNIGKHSRQQNHSQCSSSPPYDLKYDHHIHRYRYHLKHDVKQMHWQLPSFSYNNDSNSLFYSKPLNLATEHVSDRKCKDNFNSIIINKNNNSNKSTNPSNNNVSLYRLRSHDQYNNERSLEDRIHNHGNHNNRCLDLSSFSALVEVPRNLSTASSSSSSPSPSSSTISNCLSPPSSSTSSSSSLSFIDLDMNKPVTTSNGSSTVKDHCNDPVLNPRLNPTPNVYDAPQDLSTKN